jgi:hypothetical protein
MVSDTMLLFGLLIGSEEKAGEALACIGCAGQGMDWQTIVLQIRMAEVCRIKVAKVNFLSQEKFGEPISLIRIQDGMSPRQGSQEHYAGDVRERLGSLFFPSAPE